MRFEGGKAVEHWGVRDDLGMMRQLGLMPERGSTEGLDPKRVDAEAKTSTPAAQDQTQDAVLRENPM